MKYYAKLDENNVVLSAITLDDSIGANEAEDVAYLSKTYGWSKWKRTYNDGTRKNFASGPVWKYDEASDSFVEATQPFPSWTLNSSTGKYEAPTPMPEKIVDGLKIMMDWNESTQAWEHGPNVHADGSTE